MISLKRTRNFAFLLLIAIVLIQILTFVDAGGFRSSFRMRRPVNRPIFRTPVRRPIYRRPPIYRPPVHRPPTHTTTIHHPVSSPGSGKISSKNFIHTEGGGRPKPMNTANNNHIQITPPKLPPRPNAPVIGSLQKPQQSISKPMTTNVAKPYKPPGSVQTHNSNAVKPHSSNAGSSSSHSENSGPKQQTVLKPSVPMKDPLSSSTPYKPPQTTHVKTSDGSSSNKINDHKPIITTKPSAPYEPVNKVTSTNVQSASKPHVTNPGSYPAWANPDMKTPGNSKPLPSPPGNSVSSSGTPIGMSSPPIKPYKPESIQVKPNQGLSSSSSKPVSSASKPLTGPVPQKPYQASSQSSASSSSSKPSKTNEVIQTQGSSSKPVSSASKPLTGPVPQKPYQTSSQSSASSSSSKPSKTNEAMQTQGTSGAASNSGSSTKPLGSSASKPSTSSSSNNPSTNNQAQMNQGTGGTNGHPNNKPLPETPATASQSTVSNSGASMHHEMPSAPMSPGFHPHSGYPGVMPNHPMGSGYYPPPNSYSMSNVMSHGSGGDGGSGMGRLFKESLVSSLVNEAVHRVIHGPQNYHSNFDYRPINPESYQPPPYRNTPGDFQPPPPAEGHTTINNHYYFDPNATNTNQALPNNQQATNGNMITKVQPTEPISPPVTLVSNTNPATTITQESSKNDVGKIEQAATKIEQPAVMQPNVESVQDNSTVSTDNESEAVSPPIEPTIGEIVPIDNDELWNLTESMFANDVNVSQYVALNLQNSETDSVEPIEATEPLILVQKEANLLPTIKAFRDLFDNYEFDAEKTESTDSEKEEEEGAMLDEFLKTEAMIEAMQLLTDKGYVKPGQWKETLQHLWMKRFNDAMSGFERIFLAEKYPNSLIFGGQNWIYFDHQEQSKHIKYMNYRNFLNLGDNAQLLKVNYKFDDVVQSKAMLIGTSPHLEMALYTVCHFVKPNDWCTVSLGDAKFGIFTHAFMHLEKPMLDLGYLDF